MQKWDVDITEGVYWIAEEAAKSLLGSMEKEVGIKFTENILYSHKHVFEWCTLERENKKVGMFLVEKFKNKNFSQKYVKRYKNFYRECIKEMNKIDKIDLAKKTNNGLSALLEKANDYYIKNFDFGFIIEPMDFVMPGLIQKGLVKNKYNTLEIGDMLAIVDTTFLNREKQDLIKIAKAPQDEQKKLLIKHAYEYRWLQSAHMGRKDLPLSYFKSNLEKLKRKNLNKELSALLDFEKNAREIKKDLIKKKPIDKKTKRLIEITDIISPFHDRRKELFLRIVYAVDTVRMEIAKRYGYTNEELSVFGIEKIFELKDNKKLDKEFAHKMIKEGVFYANTKKNIWQFFHGEKAKKFIKKELGFEAGRVDKIKGFTASPGKISGKVKIINGIKDMDKMRQGNIIVSSMTKPEFVVAMKKAIAIITDEGGVTCHAAIISRELNIPCVIGTKIATQVLKDGDLVEVDADKGIVKIIK